ncbi:hypothetical protein CAL29_20400 [Bordetella genomosp. 10]|uniref:Uncharacterized protein n=1 Tax=Bordetella genomosp. 10 TaxID=1416804 RepID=A0A261RZ82_9BORD|nr:hypothetical protein [Bordetella genomosp. 10]OZI30396.1 hypothetical protein CAL29_20400 [Bordetella genomosp. 10]
MSNTFNMTIKAGKFADTGYGVLIRPPEGYPPNSSNMQTWRVPENDTSISEIGPKSWSGQVVAKGAKAYNTWVCEIRRALNVLGTATFQLQLNNDGVLVDAATYAGDAENFVNAATLNGNDCLNRTVSDTEGDLIVTIGPPPAS